MELLLSIALIISDHTVFAIRVDKSFRVAIALSCIFFDIRFDLGIFDCGCTHSNSIHIYVYFHIALPIDTAVVYVRTAIDDISNNHVLYNYCYRLGDG